MKALPKDSVELVGAYDAAADMIAKRQFVLGLALFAAEAKAAIANREAWLFASVIANLGLVGAVAGCIVWLDHHH
jgi:hypothetical protein